MISTFSLNKKKSKRIILIHGLFASSGYWLPYLSLLRDFNLIILNIDYAKYLENPKKNINIFTSQLYEFQDAKIIISHSLGTILVKYINYKSHLINICPVHSSTRTNKEKFISTIHKKTGLSSGLIENTFKKFDLIDLDESILGNKHKNLNFFPRKDEFFKYNIDYKNENIFFDGDHFNISDVFKIKRFHDFLYDV